MPMTSATAMMHKTIGTRCLILRFGCVTPECLAGKLLTALDGVINGLSVSAVIIGCASDTESAISRARIVAVVVVSLK